MAKKIELGDTVKDTITGFQGVAIAQYLYLNGCVRINIQPEELREGKPIEDQAFDIEQIQVVKKAKSKVVVPSGGPQPEPTKRAEG